MAAQTLGDLSVADMVPGERTLADSEWSSEKLGQETSPIIPQGKRYQILQIVEIQG